MLNGIINVYKEPDFTSHDVVAKLRGITHQKKIGHTGTLDPAAVGVLCVCLGAATHVCDMLTDETKEYEAVMLLGTVTDTQDTTGTILSESPVNVTNEQLIQAINQFVGEIEQIPPMYSALKVGGKKLYELARAGVSVERKPRKITIYDINIVNIDFPRVTMRVTCSKGTYTRTLCNDIGEKLGCGATMEHLTRTRVGRFDLSSALTLDQIQELSDKGEIEKILISPQALFEDCPVLCPTERGIKMASNGNVLCSEDISFKNEDEEKTGLHNDGQYRIIDETGFFYGIYRFNEQTGLLKPVKMFLCK